MAVISTDLILNIEDFIRDTRRAENSIQGAFDGMRRAAAGVFAGVSIGAFINETADAALAVEKLEQRFKFATGSVGEAAQEMEFARQQADRLGLSFSDAANGLSKIEAAARGTALEGAVTRELFLGIAEASAVLKLSSEEVDGALTAVEQIMSKGKTSAEELRGQLGERIPGAFQIAARAIGVTTSELDKMLEQGQVLSEDFLPAFASELRKTFSPEIGDRVEGLQASLNRLTNAAQEFFITIAETGAVDIFVNGITLLTRVVQIAGLEIGKFVNSFRDIENLDLQNTNEGIRSTSRAILDLAKATESQFAGIRDIKLGDNIEDIRAGFEELGKSGGAAGARAAAQFRLLDAELQRLRERRDDLPSPFFEFDTGTAQEDIDALKTKFQSLGKNVGDSEKEAKKAKKAYEDLIDFVINIVDRFDPVTAAYRKQAEEIKRLDEALKKGIISQERYNTLIDKLDEELKDTIDPLREFALQMKEQQRLAAVVDPALREQEQSVARLADEYTRLGLVMSDEVADGVRAAVAELQRIEQQTDSARAVTEAFTLDAREFTDAWISGLSSVANFMAEGLVNGFDNAADLIKGAFKTLLAELIRVAVLNPVLLQIGLGGLGLAGLGPGAAGTAAGGVGLLGSGLSSILGNFAGAGVSLLGQGLFGAGAGAFGSGVLASGGALSGLGLFGGTAANIGNVASLLGAGQFAAGGGALLGAALPILAPLAIGAIASGLFGNQEPPGRSQTASINITAGTLNFAGSAPGDSKFSEENRGIAQSTAQQVAAFTGVINQFEDAMLRAVSFGGDEITARLQDLIIGVEISDRDNESRIVIDTEATGRLFEEIFSKGEEAEAIASAIDFILDSLEGLPDFFAPIIEQFDRTDPERLLQGAQALADINRALEVDIVKEFNRQLRESNRTLAEVTLDQGLAVLDMARSFDGSIDATLQLSQATGQFFQTTFALLAQIQEISASLASSFQASIERFQLAALDQSQTYEFFVARAERAFNQLRDATDPAQIEQAAREFDRFLNSAFGVLSPEQQAAMSQAFIDAAEEGNRIAQERLDAAADQAATGTEQLQAAIADALGRVAGTMQAAGDAQLQAGNLQIQAAATPVTVRVEFDDAEAA